MNILFLTLLDFNSIDERGIYTDLLREFNKHGHHVYVVSPVEKRFNKNTSIIEDNLNKILKLQIGNIQKTGLIEKGISTLTLEKKFIEGIKKYFSDVKFDLVLYSTPPITLQKAVAFIKKRDNAKTYLLLKDIFPQNAVDMGMLSGIRKPLYWLFRNKEKKLYQISDRIGCMSPANCEYIKKHNPDIKQKIVEVCPNSIEIQDLSISLTKREEIRKKYGIPKDKTVFIYGGNLGKPQAVSFIIKCLKSQKTNKDVFFLIVGDGTEYGILKSYFDEENATNMKLFNRLPKMDYDYLVSACDVGLIFLDHRFTIPNFPSRLLSYMQSRIPVLVASDTHSDIGRIAMEAGFGWWCKSDDVEAWCNLVKVAKKADRKTIGDKAFEYMREHYDVKFSYSTIMKSFTGE